MWDIDLLINRALVYSTLTATLDALYLGSVVGLIALLRRFSGQHSTVAIIIPTLAIVADQAPGRRRAHRRRCDAAYH